MHFSGEITLGSIGTIVTLVIIAVGIGSKLGTLSQTVLTHAATLVDHAARMDRYEGRIISLVGDVQRMVGRIEATQDRIDRITGQRAGEGGHH